MGLKLTESVIEKAKKIKQNIEDRALHKDTPDEHPHPSSGPIPKFSTYIDPTLIIKDKILKDNPQYKQHPTMINLFSELIYMRIKQKKRKEGYVQATINQNTVGIQIDKELLDELGLVNNSIQ